MGWVYVDDTPQPIAAQRGGGCVGIGLWGLLFVVVGIMVWVIATDLGIRFAITDGPPGMTMPTAAIRTRAPAAQPAPASSGVFTTLPAPEPIAPVEVAPIVEAPVLETAPEIQALPEYVQPEQSSSEISPDWEQEVFREVAPVSEMPQMAPEGGVLPTEASSQIDPNWKCNVFGECE